MLRPDWSLFLPQFPLPARLAWLARPGLHARRRFLVAVIAAGLASPLEAQSPAGGQKFEITSIAFEGNSTLTKNELLSQMATRVTPGFLNKFLHNTISEKLGRNDEYLNLLTLGGDVRRLRSY